MMSTESDIEKNINRAETVVGLPVNTTSLSTARKMENDQQSTEKKDDAVVDGEKTTTIITTATVVVAEAPIMVAKATETEAGNNSDNAAADKTATKPDDAADEQKQASESTTIPIEQQQQQQQQQQQVILNAGKDKMDSDASYGNFKLIYFITQLVGLTAIGICAAWIGVYLGGFGGRDYPNLEFNWHPLFMTIGLIFLYGNSILVYRGFRHLHKKQLKLAHASIHMAALVCAIIALVTVFDSHNFADPPIANLYSIHSWVGLSAVIVFLLQYVFGFTAYLYPGLKNSVKVAMMPLHVYFGVLGFALAIAAAISGINEKLIFAGNYGALPTSSVLGNLLGVAILVFAALVGYLVTETSYKRKPLPEDMVLLTGLNE